MVPFDNKQPFSTPSGRPGPSSTTAPSSRCRCSVDSVEVDASSALTASTAQLPNSTPSRNLAPRCAAALKLEMELGPAAAEVETDMGRGMGKGMAANQIRSNQIKSNQINVVALTVMVGVSQSSGSDRAPRHRIGRMHWPSRACDWPMAVAGMQPVHGSRPVEAESRVACCQQSLSSGPAGWQQHCSAAHARRECPAPFLHGSPCPSRAWGGIGIGWRVCGATSAPRFAPAGAPPYAPAAALRVTKMPMSKSN